MNKILIFSYVQFANINSKLGINPKQALSNKAFYNIDDFLILGFSLLICSLKILYKLFLLYAIKIN